MVSLVVARVSDVENGTVGIDLENHILRESRSCRAGVVLRLAVSAIARQTILIEILFSEGSQTAHVDEGELIILAARVLRLQIGIERKIFIIDMQNRARGIIFVAISLTVDVTIEIERVFVTLEDVVKELAVAVYHRFGKLFFLIITYRGEVSDHENGFCAVGIELGKLIFNPDEGFIAVIALVGIECGVGVDVDADKIDAVYRVMKRAPIELAGLLL